MRTKTLHSAFLTVENGFFSFLIFFILNCISCRSILKSMYCVKTQWVLINTHVEQRKPTGCGSICAHVGELSCVYVWFNVYSKHMWQLSSHVDNRNNCLNNQNGNSGSYCTSGALFIPLTHLCVCTLVHDSGHAVAPYPVYNQDLADVELMLELLGCDGHGVEVTEAPVDKQTGRVAARCVYQNIFSKLISQYHHMDLRSH